MNSLVLVGVVALAGLAWVAVEANSTGGPSLAEGEGGAEEDPGADPSVELVDPGSGPAADPGTSPGTTASEDGSDGASGDGSSDLGASAGPSAQLAAYMQKYGHMTELERSVALAQLTENIRYERNLLFDTKFASGDYITRYPGDAPLPPPETDDKGRPMERDGRTHSDFNGSVEMRHAELRFEEAPDFYRLLEELDWLKDEVGQ